MASRKLVLFDLPSKPLCRAWSLNSWRTRLALNFKGIDYDTEWTEYQDIKLKFEHCVKPNESGFPYSIPVVKFSDGTYVMESSNIVTAIQERYPEPPLHLDSPYQGRMLDTLLKAAGAMRPEFFHRLPSRLLNPPSAEYFLRSREKLVGMPTEMYQQKEGGEKAFNAGEPHLREITAMYMENGDGPFLMGNTVCYADFIWIAALEFYRRIGDDVFEPVLERTGDRNFHLKLLEAAGPWLKRNDH